jgi:hypothetical protein
VPARSEEGEEVVAKGHVPAALVAIRCHEELIISSAKCNAPAAAADCQTGEEGSVPKRSRHAPDTANKESETEIVVAESRLHSTVPDGRKESTLVVAKGRMPLQRRASATSIPESFQKPYLTTLASISATPAVSLDKDEAELDANNSDVVAIEANPPFRRFSVPRASAELTTLSAPVATSTSALKSSRALRPIDPLPVPISKAKEPKVPLLSSLKTTNVRLGPEIASVKPAGALSAATAATVATAAPSPPPASHVSADMQSASAEPLGSAPVSDSPATVVTKATQNTKVPGVTANSLPGSSADQRAPATGTLKPSDLDSGATSKLATKNTEVPGVTANSLPGSSADQRAPATGTPKPSDLDSEATSKLALLPAKSNAASFSAPKALALPVVARTAPLMWPPVDPSPHEIVVQAMPQSLVFDGTSQAPIGKPTSPAQVAKPVPQASPPRTRPSRAASQRAALVIADDARAKDDEDREIEIEFGSEDGVALKKRRRTSIGGSMAPTATGSAGTASAAKQPEPKAAPPPARATRGLSMLPAGMITGAFDTLSNEQRTSCRRNLPWIVEAMQIGMMGSDGTNRTVTDELMANVVTDVMHKFRKMSAAEIKAARAASTTVDNKQ